MKTLKLLILLFAVPGYFGFHAFSQDTAEKKNSIGLDVGLNYLLNQDQIFSPFVHSDFSPLNLTLYWERKAQIFQEISIGYSSFNPVLTEGYEYTLNGEDRTTSGHLLTFIDLNYLAGREIAKGNHSLLLGAALFSDIRILNYVYARLGYFGYFASFSLGGFGLYSYQLNQKSHLELGIKLPLIAWLARSPYYINDGEYIKNISSHSDFRSFLSFIEDGHLSSWNEFRFIDLNLGYFYRLNERWDAGVAYSLEFFQVSYPRQLLSFTNHIFISLHYKF